MIGEETDFVGEGSKPLTNRSTSTDVDAFLTKLAAEPARAHGGSRGRLIFAMDATASRQPTWDSAARIQGEMFSVTETLGGLDVQVCFYRGYGEFRVGPFLSDAARLQRMMTSVHCHAGETQIEKVLCHAVNETRHQPVQALIFVGDCIEENIDRLARFAGELGALGLPAFMFHEGDDTTAAFAFREIARLSGGAYCRFDSHSADALRDLLAAVAVFAAGGGKALTKLAAARGGSVKLIANQVKNS